MFNSLTQQQVLAIIEAKVEQKEQLCWVCWVNTHYEAKHWVCIEEHHVPEYLKLLKAQLDTGGGATSRTAAAAGAGQGEDESDKHLEYLKLGYAPPNLPALADFIKFFYLEHDPELRVPVDYLTDRNLAGIPERKWVKVCPTSRATRLLSTLIREGPQLHHMDTTTVMAYFINLTFQLFKDCSDFNVSFDYDISYNRAEKQVTTRTITKNARANMYLTADMCVLFLGEDNAESMAEAEEDLENKLRRYSSTDRGPVENLLGYAAAHYKVQFYVITHQGAMKDVKLIQLLDHDLNLTEMRDRVLLVLMLSKIFRMISSMRKALPPNRKHILHHTVIKQQRSEGPDAHRYGMVTCDFTFTSMIKRIKHFERHLTAFGTTFEAIDDAFDAACEARTQAHAAQQPQFLVICCEGWPTLEETNKMRKTSKNAVKETTMEYESVTYPLGWTERVLTEEKLRMVAVACLKTAKVLHAAELVYRDWRVQNIVWIKDTYAPQTPMVIDLETVAAADAIWPAGTPWLTSWDHNTLDAGRKYTKQSDLRQIGLLLQAYPLVDHLSQAGLTFIDKLVTGQFSSAELALADTLWLAGFERSVELKVPG